MGAQQFGKGWGLAGQGGLKLVEALGNPRFKNREGEIKAQFGGGRNAGILLEGITEFSLNLGQDGFNALKVGRDRDRGITELGRQGLPQTFKPFKQQRFQFAIGDNIGLTEPPKEIFKAMGNTLDAFEADTSGGSLEGVSGAHEGMRLVHAPLTTKAKQLVLQGLQQFGCFLLEVAVALGVQIIKHGRNPLVHLKAAGDGL